MSKKSRCRGPFDKQYGKRAEERLKSTPQHLHHLQWSLPSQLIAKKSSLLTCKILVQLVNTLAADGKHPVLNRDILTIPIQLQLSQKQKTFSELLAKFLKSRLNFKHFEKKMTLIAFVLWNLPTPKTLLDKCLKHPVSVHRSTRKTVDVPKHCLNLHHSILILFTNHCPVY